MIASQQKAGPRIQKMFDEALRHHQAGRLEDAYGIYQHILSIDPQHADSLHLLGVIRHQAGHLDEAAALISRAILIKKDAPAYYSNLASVLKSQGRLDEAI